MSDDNVKQVRIQFIADTSKLKKGAETAKKSLDGVKKEAEAQKDAWADFRSALNDIAPDIGKTADEAKEMGAKLKDAFSGAGDDAKGFKAKLKGMAGSFKKLSLPMKLGIAGIIAAVAITIAKTLAKVVKVAWDAAKETARAYNSQKYDTALEKRQASMRKLKTSIGAFTSPIVNAINTAIGGILDGVTWLVKKIHAGLSLVYGFLKGLIIPVINAIKAGIDAVGKALTPVFDAIKSGINAVARFLGFGDVFKKTTEGAEKASDAVEKVGEESEFATGALQSFDKLNTMDTGTGDADTAEQIDKASNAMQALGESTGGKVVEFIRNLPNEIKKALKEIPKWFKKNVIDKILNINWEQLYDDICAELGKIPKWFQDNVIDKITDIDWQGLYDGFCETVGPAGDWFRDNILNPLLGFNWQGLYDGFCETIGPLGDWFEDNILDPLLDFNWQGLYDGFCETVGPAGDWFEDNVLDPILDFNWQGLWDGFCETMGNLKDWILDKLTGVLDFDWGELWEKFKETMKNIATFITDQIRSGIDGAVGGITSFVQDPVGGIKSLPGKAVDKFKGLFGGADGMVAKPNDPFPILVGDNTKEPEVLSPVSTMKTAFKEAMSEMGGYGGYSGSKNSKTEIVLQVDGKTLARATYDDLMAEGARRGRGTIA